MIKKDPGLALDKIQELHCAMNGILMMSHSQPLLHDLAVNLRIELRSIIRLLTGDDV